MQKSSLDADIWKEYLLKKLKGHYFPNAKTLYSKNANEDFQIFEVLVSETIQLLYPDYFWHTTPAQGDGGVDFYGEQEARPMPALFQMPSRIIYGQVKRKKASFRQEELINSTNKMIRYYFSNDIQKKSLQQLIHVISSDGTIALKLGDTIEYKDSLIYVVTTINSEDLFRLWACNPKFLKTILPERQMEHQRDIFLKEINKIYKPHAPSYTSQISINSTVYCGQPFEVSITFTSCVPFPMQFSAAWIQDTEAPIYLVAPQGLFQQYGDYSFSLLHSYRLTLQFKSATPGVHCLGYLRITAQFGTGIDEIALGNIEIKRAFMPAYFELPNHELDERLCRELDNHDPDLSFYAVVGEGGIGKSSFLQEISDYAINCGYRSITVKHPCEITDEADFWRELFQQLMGPSDGELSFHDTIMSELRTAMGVYYQESWKDILLELFQSGSMKRSGELLDCWLCLSILAVDREPIFLWISNMHWCSCAAIEIFHRYLKILQQNRNYFRNKLIIVFEGRTEETLKTETKRVIPFEWITFQKSHILKQIRLRKWSKPLCRQYINALLNREEASDSYLEQSYKIRQFLITYGSGNPMHINELIRYLEQRKNLEYQDDGKLTILSSVIIVPEHTLILDIIRARVAYYRKISPLLVDFLILGAHLIEWPFFRQYAVFFYRQYDGNPDDILAEMGFVTLNPKTGNFSLIHEHYKTILLQTTLSCDHSVTDCLDWAQTAGIQVPVHIECRLRLLCQNINYTDVCSLLLAALKSESDDLISFELLQLLEQIPGNTLEECGMPLYHLYRMLESSCMGMGNWETAEQYVQSLKQLKGDTPSYYIDLLFARKSLSNNYSFRMKFEYAQEECEEAIIDLENYLLSEPEMTADEKRTLKRELCMLKNRLSIIFFLSGKHKKARDKVEEALLLAQRENDQYVKYHIQYEMGLWELRSNPQQGLALISEAYNKLPQVELLAGTQEMDLVRADYLMAQLKVAGIAGRFPMDMLRTVKKEAAEGCRRLSNTRERVESMLYHTIYGIVAIIEGNLQEALRYFQMGAEIAYQASLVHMIWKMHLNLAQCYCLLLQDQSASLYEEYQHNMQFHAEEALMVLNQALLENARIHGTFQKVLAYPMALAEQFMKQPEIPQLSGISSDYCGIHINYQGYAFFLLD